MTSTIDNNPKYVFVSADHGNVALRNMKQLLDSDKVSNCVFSPVRYRFVLLGMG